MRTVISLTSWTLDADWDPLREPPRDPAIRSIGYEDEFDYRTVFYDVFWDERGETIIALGPPLINLKADLDIRFRALPSGELCAFTLDHRVLVDRFTIRPPAGTTALVAETRAASVLLAPQPNLASLFAGTRAVFTLSKDNDPAWVRDWARFYVVNHGCDAVAVYDNGSSAYSSAELAEVLATVPGLRRSLVLDWDFPYGVFDLRQTPALHRMDSLYCQLGCFEHARLRLFRDAASVTNVDVDELIVAEASGPDGPRTVHEAAEATPSGVALFRGFWIGCHPDDLTDEIARAPRHRHFWKTNPQREGCPMKWTALPGRMDPDVQWYVHDIRSVTNVISRDFAFRHFRPLNTNWTVDRVGADVLRTDTALDRGATEADLPLKAALERAFPPDAPDLPLPARRGETSAEALRVRAGTALRAGGVEAALDLARRARALAPGHANLALYEAQLLRRLGREEEAATPEAEAARIREASPHHAFQMAWEGYNMANMPLDDALSGMQQAVRAAPALHRYAAIAARLLASYPRDYASALELIDLAKAHGPEDPDLLLDAFRADFLLRAGAADDAFAALTPLFEAAPHDVRLQLPMASALNARGEAEKALALLDLALGVAAAPATERMSIEREAGKHISYAPFGSARAPCVTDVLWAKKDILLRLDRFAEAVEAQREIVRLLPHSPDHRSALASLLAKADMAEAAAAVWEEARQLAQWSVAITPPVAPGRRTRGETWSGSYLTLAMIEASLENHEAALRAVDEAGAVWPETGRVGRFRRDILTKIGRHDEALDEQRRLIALAPADVGERDRLARMLANLQRHAEAAQALEEAIALQPEPSAESYARLAGLFKRAGETARVVEAASTAVQLNPLHGGHWAALSSALGEAGRREEAFAAAQEAARLSPQDVLVQLRLGRAANAVKDHATAATAFEAALAVDPDRAEAHFLFSVACRALGREQEALSAAERAVALAADAPRYAEHLLKLRKATGASVASA